MIMARATLMAGYAAVPPGHLATVVTSLEMVRPPSLPPPEGPFPPGFALQPIEDRDPETYRSLFRDVGADWLWFSRLALTDDALAAILADGAVEILVLRQAGRNVGMLELDFRQPGSCELVFLGLTEDVIGTGFGGRLMAHALRRAWSWPIARFWLHTCTLDHPGALAFYRRFGFTPCATHVEVAPDPRLTGLLPRDCAPHVPLLG